MAGTQENVTHLAVVSHIIATKAMNLWENAVLTVSKMVHGRLRSCPYAFVSRLSQLTVSKLFHFTTYHLSFHLVNEKKKRKQSNVKIEDMFTAHT